MTSSHRTSIVRKEIVALAGEDGLNPPIQNPAESLWDMHIGSTEADVFRGFNTNPRRVVDSPQKLLATQGIHTLRDAAIVGASLLASVPDLGPVAVIHMWRGMHALEPSMSLPFNPNMPTKVSLSFGDIGRVPLAAATQKWLPGYAVDMFQGQPTVQKAVELIEEKRTPYLFDGVPSQARFEHDVSEFVSQYRATLSQGEEV